jgi:hypothetical protein
MGITGLRAFPFTTTVYVGGGFEFLGYSPNYTPRNFLAAIDATTGVPTSWDPNMSGQVNAMALRIQTTGALRDMYVGGTFTLVGGQSRPRIAQVGANAAPTAWSPISDGPVDAITFSGGAVYAGGEFGNIGGRAAPFLAQLDPTTGVASTWNPGLDSEAGTLAFANGLVFAGGGFRGAVGLPHSSLTALSESLPATGVGASPASPSVLDVAPNPSRGDVQVEFSLPRSQPTVVSLYDLAGRRVRNLVNGPLEAGSHRLTWDGRTEAGAAVGPGIYFLRVTGAGLDLRGKLIRLP